MKKDYAYPEGKAVKVWDFNGVQCSLVKNTSTYDGEEWYCGYVRFAKNPFKHVEYPEDWRKNKHGLENYVPIHGGITYGDTTEKDGTAVYGFDCHHYRDENREELKDVDYLAYMCEKLAKNILICAKYEDEYHNTEDDHEKRMAVLQRMEDELGGLELHDNVFQAFSIACGVL